MTSSRAGAHGAGEAPVMRLTDRLRGKYVLAVNDGAGPLNGSNTFTRQFETPPIQQEAAEVIEVLTAALKLAEQFIVNGVELGFIRLPTEPDPALKTLPAIRAALLRTQPRGAEHV